MMQNQKLILTIGFILLAIIGYQGYLLYQKDAPQEEQIIEKKIVKKDAPEIHINIDKTPSTDTSSVDTQTPAKSNLSDEERAQLDQENIEQSIQNLFKSIFASKEVQDSISEIQKQAQEGFKELQAQLQDFPSQLDNLSKEMKSDPFFGQILGQLKNFSGKQLEDKGDYYYLQTAVAGGKESKIDIQTKGKFLTIMIEGKEEMTKETQSGTITQSSAQMRKEIIMIPSDALVEKLQTNYENGILEITIPKVKAKTNL